jgi:hypothetical protein
MRQVAKYYAILGKGQKPTVTVTGATTTTDGLYTVQSWTTSGSIAVAGASLDVEYLVVAGGGAGGNAAAHGGGGAGGLLTNVGGSSLSLTAATHTVTVGAGGVAGSPGTNGSDSSIAALVVATGGGRGGYSSTFRAGAAGDYTEKFRVKSTGSLTIKNAANLELGTTTGTKIGTATTQKLGFYNATPVVQPVAVANAVDTTDIVAQFNALLARMRDLGLIAT